MSYCDHDEYTEQAALAQHQRSLLGRLMRHPDPRDPEYPLPDPAEVQYEQFQTLIEFVRGQVSQAEKHMKAGRIANARLDLEDAAFDIHEWLRTSK